MFEGILHGVSSLSLAGESLGSWVLLNKLGEGGMSVVYEARHVWMPRSAAIKIVKPSVMQDPSLMKRFRQEAFLVSQLAHENIVEIKEFALDPKHGFFMVMELLEGRELADLLNIAPLPKSLILSITKQMCEGLSLTHRMDVVHRDLKPSNVFLIENHPTPHVKLLDFGIAKHRTLDKGLTATNAVMGTAAYLAPEQAAGFKNAPLSSQVDIYALGVLLYQMFGGVLPFSYDTLFEQMKALASESPPLIRSVREDLAGTKIELLLHRLLSKRPMDRPESVDLVQEELTLACMEFDDPLENKGQEDVEECLRVFWSNSLEPRFLNTSVFVAETAAICLDVEDWNQKVETLKSSAVELELMKSAAMSLDALGEFERMSAQTASIDLLQRADGDALSSVRESSGVRELIEDKQEDVFDHTFPEDAETPPGGIDEHFTVKVFDGPSEHRMHQEGNEHFDGYHVLGSEEGYREPYEIEVPEEHFFAPVKEEVHLEGLLNTSYEAAEVFSAVGGSVEEYGPLEDVGLSLDSLDQVGYGDEGPEMLSVEAEPLELQSAWALSAVSLPASEEVAKKEPSTNAGVLSEEELQNQLSDQYQEHSRRVVEAIQMFHSSDGLPAASPERLASLHKPAQERFSVYEETPLDSFHSNRFFWSLLLFGGCLFLFLIWMFFRFPGLFGRS